MYPFDEDPPLSGIDWEENEEMAEEEEQEEMAEEEEQEEMDSDESDEYYDEKGRLVVEVDYSKMEYSGPNAAPVSVVRPSASSPSPGTEQPALEGKRAPDQKKKSPKSVKTDEIRYTMKDMTPTIRDPRCTSKTQLACFWPVYVGNFKDEEVDEYFATHGLHARWWFRRTDDYFMDFQCQAGLYDMLVYFVSQEDAEQAIERCHRDKHKGYTLNVFPGREPVYFPEGRSVYAERMKSGRIFSEHFFEKHVRFICQVQVECVVKYNMMYGAMEFSRPEEVAKAQQKERMWTYHPVQGKLQKQRFLEKDVLAEIEKTLTQFPGTLKVKSDDKILGMLLRGCVPYVNRKQIHPVIPLRRGPSKKRQTKIREKKLKKKYANDGY